MLDPGARGGCCWREAVEMTDPYGRGGIGGIGGSAS